MEPKSKGLPFILAIGIFCKTISISNIPDTNFLLFNTSASTGDRVSSYLLSLANNIGIDGFVKKESSERPNVLEIAIINEAENGSIDQQLAQLSRSVLSGFDHIRVIDKETIPLRNTWAERY